MNFHSEITSLSIEFYPHSPWQVPDLSWVVKLNALSIGDLCTFDLISDANSSKRIKNEKIQPMIKKKYPWIMQHAHETPEEA